MFYCVLVCCFTERSASPDGIVPMELTQEDRFIFEGGMLLTGENEYGTDGLHANNVNMSFGSERV